MRIFLKWRLERITSNEYEQEFENESAAGNGDQQESEDEFQQVRSRQEVASASKPIDLLSDDAGTGSELPNLQQVMNGSRSASLVA